MTQLDMHDDAIRSALRELRATDERLAPSYETVWERPPRVVHLSLARPVAIAAGVILVAAIGYRAFASGERITVPTEVIALSTWEPPTHVLLEASRASLLTQAPELGASLIDTGIQGDLR